MKSVCFSRSPHCQTQICPAHTHWVQYSKRCNALINNASMLHVYAIYSQRLAAGEGAILHNKRAALRRPITR